MDENNSCWPPTWMSWASADGDGIVDAADNCPTRGNSSQEDFDDDARGDLCDNCRTRDNADQADDDGDGVGNVCE